MERLTDIVRSLGISEYLGDFIAAGFFTWDDLLDITVAELESLSVKRGHRRESNLSIPIKNHLANTRYRSFNEK
ncbi:hypothetical protein V502_01185 [Pseudogymnoascus sp. VKM F-4520 (FW-2644)]|nr:hypothetical protein V502_01185 [Pseudogymnoascus sp. VKM F-4520 (FW-2644)]